MIRKTLTTVVALTLAAGCAWAEEPRQREVYGQGEIFQNVAAEHVKPLLRNTAFVARWSTDYVRITWHDATGHDYSCLVDDTGKTWNDDNIPIPYRGVILENKRLGFRYPLKQNEYPNGDHDYQLLRYDGATGGMTTFIGFRNRWWEGDVGHLQARLPAVIWEICPSFPSAKSIGAKVNKKQTSRFYSELVAQHPGQRILRPQYVNEHAHEIRKK